MIEVFNDATKMYTVITILTVLTLLVEIVCVKATSLDIAKNFSRVFY